MSSVLNPNPLYNRETVEGKGEEAKGRVSPDSASRIYRSRGSKV